ncbi:neuraminidase-like domain-containing protein [Pedobacter steynii]|uniref:Virulence plasmid A protein n=1 Tax=Pedobacter steynii TaxID=430522 RepID=A0A1D7QKZ0_9SPHI|nr:neuraminidase-like domain-containing protein [Pedobacter steynii]AOM79320.1 hypothetical protein BFS30_20405 [Pedobacter steynii]
MSTKTIIISGHIVNGTQDNEQEGYTVSGQVLENGMLANGLVVTAYDQDLPGKRIPRCLLGKYAVTDREGRFFIAYTAAEFKNAENRSADLVLTVSGRKEELLYTTPVYFNATQNFEIEISFNSSLLLYDYYLNQILPLLDGEVPLEQLTTADIAFSAGETGLDEEKITSLKSAFINQDKTGLPAWAFFGLATIPLAPELWPQQELRDFARRLKMLQPASESRDSDLGELAKKLMEYARENTVFEQVSAHKAVVNELLKPIFQSDERMESFLDLYIRHDGEIEDFWKQMEQQEHFGNELPAIQLSLQLSQVTMGNHQLVLALQANGLRDTLQLADLSEEDWVSLVSKYPEGIPKHIVADTDRERAMIYAGELQTIVEMTFPTAVIKNTVATAPLRQFLEVNPDFDFTRTPAEIYLQDQGEAAWRGIENKTEVIKELRLTQRLYAVTASAKDTLALMKMGVDSALQISKMSFDDFLNLSKGNFNEADATLYFHKATAITEAAAMTYLQLDSITNRLRPDILGHQLLPELPVIPNWENLFGQVETCECKHCKSVYSPAAYFVDLLHILLGQQNGKARKELFRRRPDLKYTKLSCEHTDTLISYTDLVNEILETYVAQDNIGNTNAEQHAALASNDTSGLTANELSANPQHPNPVADQNATIAYQLLSESVFPLTLPFDLSLETAREFLKEQNSSLYELIDTFAPAGSFAALSEGLGLSELEFNILIDQKIIAGPAPSVQNWDIGLDLYGYFPGQLSGNLGEKLSKVREFISRTTIAYTDLVALVETQFLNPDQQIVLALAVPSDVAEKDKATWQAAHACDLEFTRLIHQDLSVLTDEELGRFNRFLRLWKKMGCTIPELDVMLMSCGDDFTADMISQLSILWQLMAELNLPAAQAAVLIADIPAFGNNSYYDHLFLNRAILQIDDKFELNPDRKELKYASETIKDHQPAICAAFRISEQELNEVLQLAGIDMTAAGTLTLSNLSATYRIVLTAKKTKLKIHELFLMMPFAPYPAWSSLQEFKKNRSWFNQVKSNGLNAAEIAYLFDNQIETGSTFPPKKDVISKAAQDIREGLTKISQAAQIASGTITADFLKTQLGLFCDEKTTSQIIGILEGSNVKADPDHPLPPLLPADLSFLEQPPLAKEYQLLLPGYLTLADLTGISNAQTAVARIELFWLKVSEKLIPHLKNNFIIQYLTAHFKTEAALIAFVMKELSGTALLLEEDTPANFTAFETDYIKIFKLLWLVNKLKLSAEELDWFQSHPDHFNGFNWSDLSKTQFSSWMSILDYLSLRNAFPEPGQNLMAIFKAAVSNGDIRKAIVELSGWNNETVAYFVDQHAATEFVNEQMLLILKKQQALSLSIGISVEKLQQLGTEKVGFNQSQDIKRTLKANYDEASWIEVSTKIHNRLRNKQRDALVAYLLQKPEIRTIGLKQPNDLYGYFMIDVEMNACTKTSRLKQAISSVQLFVQRCLLNLEKNVSPPLIDAGQWEWMKLYRVWEANRKVFLYPENWIEPELRDNKSPFFTALESELLQSEVTAESVETALMNYLHKLDEVGRLDIYGMFQDPTANEIHVFGRTFSGPTQYYYRKLNLATHEWTPWDKVEVDIQNNEEGESSGVHLIPVVWNRRLYLFWPIFTKKTDEAQRNRKDEGEYEWSYWEVRMAWSEYKQKRWSTKKISNTFITTKSDRHGASKPLFYKFSAIPGASLIIRMHHNPLSSFYIGEFKFNCDHKVSVTEADLAPEMIQALGPTQVNYYQSLLSAVNSGRAIKHNTDKSVPLILTDYGKKNKTILKGSIGEYKIIYSSAHQFRANSLSAFFYQDKERAYYVEPRWEWPFRLVEGVRNRDKTVIPFVPPDLYTETNKFPKKPDPIAERPNVLERISDEELTVLFERENISANMAMQLRGQEQQKTTLMSASLEYNYTGALVLDRYLGSQSGSRVSKLDFKPFFHGYVCDFISALAEKGVHGLLQLTNQTKNDYVLFPGANFSNSFQSKYKPDSSHVHSPFPLKDVDFSLTGAYSIYNWELFFHIPMLLANRLSKNQKFEEARYWYHFIFNPTTNDVNTSSRRYWQVLPLRNTPAETLEVLMQQLHKPAGDPKRLELEQVIRSWRANPFNPHLIARMRLVAYQKNVLMRYLDNLIVWADNLFRQDTIETINEATQLYILAAELLGKRPEKVPSRGDIEAKNYKELEDAGLNTFSNALIMLETTFPFFNLQSVTAGQAGASAILSTTVPANYFGLPGNEKLLGYWDLVADRLFKIRHCQNIEGMERQLALFEPPIDPALLVQAMSKGISINSVLADLNAPLPYYRFGYIVQKALELCADLKSMGNTLLSVLEKKDGEALSMLRSQQETILLNLSKTLKTLQIKEAQRNREGLEKTKEVTQYRETYYSQLIENGLNSSEKEHQLMSTISMLMSISGQAMEMASAASEPIPDFYLGALVGISGGPINLNHMGGGTKTGATFSAISRFFNSVSTMTTFAANMAQSNAGYQRRREEWSLQKQLAAKELGQIDKQILASQIREQMAAQELSNHEQQIEHSRQVEDFMRNKYTREELYGWMTGEIATVYFQCYQLAYDLAKKAEKNYRHELGLSESNFIQFGIWDSFRKGLMSGERLYLSLKQMEKAYMDQNRREYELNKNISLMQHFPMALLQLKTTGSCIIELPEALFDADYPGQYLRRIRNISVSIPCIVGPYTSVNCTLSLLSSKTRVKNVLKGGKYEEDPEADDRFEAQFGAIQSIATSHAQNDSGMFELNFRDERYLPFEYSGAISRWKIDLPPTTNAFNFDTISDVILHLKYTSRAGGAQLKTEALKISSGRNSVMLTLKNHFSNEWYQYNLQNKDKAAADLPALNLMISKEKLPFFARNAEIVSPDSHAYTFTNTEKDSLPKAVEIQVEGTNISFKPDENMNDIADIVLILELQQ